VIATRPQEKATPMPQNGIYGTGGLILQPTPVVIVQTTEGDEEKSDLELALDRSYPPLSKDMFPGGVRIISIEGLPETTTTTDDETATTVVSSVSDEETLVLLIPQDKVEELALALQQGSQVYVTLLARGTEGPTEGFSYWDFEEWFKSDRETIEGQGE